MFAAIAAVLVLAGIFAWAWKGGKPLKTPDAATPPFLSDVVAAAKPEESNRWYYVSGEVRVPNRHLYNGRITLLRAITAAGDFTDFAERTRVKVTSEDGRSQTVNCVKVQDDPSLDPEIRPGDQIFVGRRTDSSASPAIPSRGTNVNSDQRAAEAFARRYGLDRSVAPRPGAATDSPEAAFARRYGLRPPDLRPETNVAVVLVPGATTPLYYQWSFGTNKPAGITSPGPNGLVITKLTPLYLKITLDSVEFPDSGPRYVIGVQNEAGAEPRRRAKRQYYCSLDHSGPQDAFTLREVKAPPDNPTNATVVLELKDSGERVPVSKDQPFQRLEGFAADLRYEPENKTWTNRRVGNVLRLAGDEAQIIAITRMEVLMGVKSTGKTWAIEYKGAPADPSHPPESDAAPKQP